MLASQDQYIKILLGELSILSPPMNELLQYLLLGNHTKDGKLELDPTLYQIQNCIRLPSVSIFRPLQIIVDLYLRSPFI